MPEWLDTPVPLWLMFLTLGILWFPVWLRLGRHDRELRELRGKKAAQKPASRRGRLYNRFIQG